MDATVNTRIVLASRPQGLPAPENFRIEQASVPAPGLGRRYCRVLGGRCGQRTLGATIGQIAKLRDALRFDAALDHRAPDLAERLREAVSDGIDVDFGNVDGKVSMRCCRCSTIPRGCRCAG